MHLIKLTLVILLLKKNSVAQSEERCGIQKIKTKELILRGYKTYPGQFPWHVAIMHSQSRDVTKYACGGSLISRTFVLTTAHCVKSENGNEINVRRLFVYAGIHDKQNLGQYFQHHKVYEIHRVSQKDQWVNLKNDIALLELNGNARLTNYVQPICLNSLDVSIGRVGFVPGWGRTEEHETSDILKASSMPIVSTIDCLASDRGAFGATLDDGMVCAGYRNGTTVCTGDSGGGLAVKQCSIAGCLWSLVGIVSFAGTDEKGSCRSDGYGVFTKVKAYLPWIEEVTDLQIEDYHTDDYCGQRRSESLRTRWPWHGTLYRTDSKPFIDGSPVSEAFAVTILNDQFVITTGIVHQLIELDPVVHRLRFGRVADGVTDHYTQDMSIDSVFVNSEGKNDYQTLVLFKLGGQLQFTKYVQPICLWKGNSTLDSEAYTVSFDRSKPGSKQHEEPTMAIDSSANCEEESKQYNGSRNLQIFCGKNKDMNVLGPRFWDIGTGLVMRRNNRWYLEGLFSIVMGQHPVAPVLKKEHALYLNVTHFYSWVVSTIESNSN